MKLVTFQNGEKEPEFGVLVKDKIVSFSTLQGKCGKNYPDLDDIYTYLDNLPVSQKHAKELCKLGEGLIDQLGDFEYFTPSSVKILPPIPKPAALIDFGLTPRHLLQSAMTIIEHEYSGLKKIIARKVLKGRVKKMGKTSTYPFYVGNHNAVIGHDDTTHWPLYTSYLDIEPELAVVTGPKEFPVAGYVIFNDFSARDVQMPELDELSLTRSKQFDKGNGLGPYLVTPDEIHDPLDIEVSVTIGDRLHWKGHTKEYSIHPEMAINYLHTIFTPAAGTVVGLGTIPDCCGLDNNQWLNPGERVEITFQGLGTLRQHIPSKIGHISPSRWAKRDFT